MINWFRSLRRNPPKQANRIPHGGRIRRNEIQRFTFDGRVYEGYGGDSLASALLASGVHHVGRSFKYHRPRGIVTSGVEEMSGLVQIGHPRKAYTSPNMRCPEVELHDGLEAVHQNAWPDLKFDVMGINQKISRLFPAGFYYKTFMWPKWAWDKVYEPAIRRAAGLGKCPDMPDPERYSHRYAHCDVLIVGGGPSGLAAAGAAASTGARVMLVHERPEWGGGLLHESDRAMPVIEGREAHDWAASEAERLAALPNVTVLSRTTATGFYHHNFVTLLERCQDHLPIHARKILNPRQRLWKVRAAQVVLATGAIERSLVFRGNDRPGVMLAGAGRFYLNHTAVAAGRRPVVVTNNNSAYMTALDMRDHGIDVQAVIDTRSDIDEDLEAELSKRQIPLFKGHTVLETFGTFRVKAVRVEPLAGGKSLTLECDALFMSGGWTPSVHLHCHAGGKLAWNSELHAFTPDMQGWPDRAAAGAVAGVVDLETALQQGYEAGKAAAGRAGYSTASPETPLPKAEQQRGEYGLKLGSDPYWALPDDEAQPESQKRHAKAFVDLQNDVTIEDLELALKEGYKSPEHLKRYTTTGMATDQGKTGNLNALHIMGLLEGKSVPDIGVTTYRPPYSPQTLGAMAGRGRHQFFAPVRVTPMHDWHKRHGAVFEDVGMWKRPFCFPRDGETEDHAVQREALTVRTQVGMLDGSTLGKIDVQGKDAGTFLDRIYANMFSSLKVGRCRYGIMCKEDGMVMDDGVTARIGENHFHMTTTTGGAANVMAWLETWHQTEWPELDVQMTSTTDQWAVCSVAGPKTREVLARIVDDLDLSQENFKFMMWKDGHVCGGIPARIFRISFSGELSFEINVPAAYGAHVWQAVMDAGEEYGICAYGTEVMHLLRAEKGLIIIGQETDGSVTPQDLGMDWIVSDKKDFIGKRSLSQSGLAAPDRKQLVGLLPDDKSVVLEEGAQILDRSAGSKPPVPMLGHVTSSYYSPVMKTGFALAMLKGGLKHENEIMQVDQGAKRIPVKVVKPFFYDPDGEKLRS